MTLHREMTQKAYVLDLLKRRESVRSDELRAAYMSNPSEVVSRLKQDGWNIETDSIKVRGQRRVSYRLNREQPRIEAQERAPRRMPTIQPTGNGYAHLLQRLVDARLTIPA